MAGRRLGAAALVAAAVLSIFPLPCSPLDPARPPPRACPAAGWASRPRRSPAPFGAVRLRGGGGEEDGGPEFPLPSWIPPITEDPDGIMDDMPELHPKARYAGVAGEEDDGYDSYRLSAIKKDIMDWDIDETRMDNVTMADPEEIFGSKAGNPSGRDPEQFAPDERITLPMRPDAFKNLPPVAVDPNDEFGFDAEDEEDFSSTERVVAAAGLAEAKEKPWGVSSEENDGIVLAGKGAAEEEEGGGGKLSAYAKNILDEFLGEEVVEEYVVPRDTYTGPVLKGEAVNASEASPPVFADDGKMGWGDDEREVVDENGEVWITSSPQRRMPPELKAVVQEGGLAGALQRFYAVHNSSNAHKSAEIAKKFQGEVAVLNQMLRKKYGADLGVEWEKNDTPKSVSSLDDLDADTGTMLKSATIAKSNKVDKMIAEAYAKNKEKEESMKIHQENMQKISKMSKEEIEMARNQIAAELSPNVIELLTKRGEQRLSALHGASLDDLKSPNEEEGGEEGIVRGGYPVPVQLRAVPKTWVRGPNDTFWEFLVNENGPWVHRDEIDKRTDKMGAILQQEHEQKEMFANMHSLDPSNVDVLLRYARFCRDSAKDNTRALELYQRAVKLQPDGVECLSEYGLLLHQHRNAHDEAQRYLETALKFDPQHVPTISNYGVLCHAGFRDMPAAWGMYLEALRLEPDHVPTLSRLGFLIQNETGSEDEAAKMYEKVLARDPNHASTLGNYARLLHGQSEFSEAGLQAADRAEDMYQRAIMLNPSDVETLYSYGVFQNYKREDLLRAELLFRTALEEDHTHSGALCQYGKVLRMMGKESAAEDLYKQALLVAPTSVEALSEYGHFLHVAREDKDGAEQHYRAALALDPGHVSSLNSIASLLWEEEGGCVEAEQFMFAALKLAPHDADTVLNCASYIWEKRGDGERARRMVLRVLQANPLNVEALSQYALMELRMKSNIDGALGIMERALGLQPGNEGLTEGLEWFKEQKKEMRAREEEQIRQEMLQEDQTRPDKGP